MKKSTLISVVVFLVLLLAVILSRGGRSERGMTRISFAAVEPASIDRVVITGPNPVELERKGETWLLADGREADPRAVQRLVEAIPRIESSNLVTEDESRFAALEVGEAKGSRVEVFTGDRQLAAFTVGKSAPGGAHIRVDDAVYLVKRVYPYVFSRKSATWYDLALFDTDKENVVRVEVKPAKDTSYALVKRDDVWQLEDPGVVPEGFRFDPKAAASLVNSLVGLRAREIVTAPPGPGETGLDQPAFVLAFADKEGGRQVLEIGAATEKNNVYARVRGEKDVVLLSRYTAERLQKKPTDLRDLTMMDLDPDKVSRLVVQGGDHRLVLARQGADWTIQESSEKVPDDFQLDPQRVDRRLQSFANTRAIKPAPAASIKTTGLASPKVRLEATLEDGSTVTLNFGKETKDENRNVVYARGNADDAIYLVSKGIRSSLTAGLEALRKRKAPPGGMPNLDPQALSKLPPEVRAKLMRQMQQKRQQQQMMKALQQQAQQGATKAE